MTEETPTAPIFIVGCQRSGTTMLRLVLDSHSRISCGPETRFLADMERIVTSDWRRLQRYGLEREEWLRRIAEFFAGIQNDYAERRGKVRWADKTPLYALNIPFLAELFPTAQFVHVIRDGRDVAVSHRKRFGYASSLNSARKWPSYIRIAREAAEALPPERYREVRYEALVGQTEQTLRDLLDWLGEEWEPEVLEYNRTTHDVPEKYSVEADQRRRSASGQDAIYGSSVGSHRRQLDPLTRVAFAVFARGTLKELGYS